MRGESKRGVIGSCIDNACSTTPRRATRRSVPCSPLPRSRSSTIMEIKLCRCPRSRARTSWKRIPRWALMPRSTLVYVQVSPSFSAVYLFFVVIFAGPNGNDEAGFSIEQYAQEQIVLVFIDGASSSVSPAILPVIKASVCTSG